MVKTPFTMRLDDEIRALAENVAADERRSLSSLIEVALLEYAERRGYGRSGTKREDGGAGEG